MSFRIIAPSRLILSRLTYRQHLAALSCLVSAVGFCASFSTAHAQTATPAKKSSQLARAASTSSAGHARTRSTKAIEAHGAEEISVGSSRRKRNGGGGMMRLETAPHAVQTVTKEYIDMRSPVSTALDLVKNLPSVNVTTPDTSGMQGGQVQTRGLTDRDMAIMVDGISAGQAKYLAEIIDSENVDEVSITPGSAARDLPVMSAAGGVMNSKSHIASHKFGGMTDFSYGTNNLSREFIRLDSGDIGNTGIRGYFSFSNTHARSWMGSGINERKHIDFGARKDWENGSNANLFISWNSADWTIDNYPTEDQFMQYKHTGQGWDRSSHPGNANYWKNNADHWNQIFLSAPIHTVITDKLSFDLHPYLTYGQGWSAKPNGAEANPAGDMQNTVGYFQEHGNRVVGATASLGYDIDRHNHLTFGYWYNNSVSDRSYPTSFAMPAGGAPSPNWSQYRIDKGDRQVAGYEIHSLFIQDTAKYLHDKLLINGGFKFVMSNAWNKDYYGRQGRNSTAPLPQLSISYNINDQNQIYVNAEGDYRQPTENDMGWLYTDVPILKNQYSIKEELGYRYHNRYMMMDLSFFNYNVTNRVVDQYLGMNNYRPFSIGSQTMRGLDFMIAGREIHGFSPYASVEYLHATQDSNVFDPYQNVMLHSKGTQAIMAPRVMANFGLTYKYKGFFANGSVHYTGPQSVSVAGDQRIPGYVTNSLTVGYHFKPFGFVKSPTFRLNFTNLTGSIVRTGAMGAVYSKHDPGTVYSGSSAAYTGYGNTFMVEPRFSMTGTISTSF
ncbi:TonB-dependent receptor [Acetobacter pomorum]|uniref:TonB-dependent receptor n=1 Tax=Acetobacter pomorum TaxID=65959 RepID=A0A2G4RBE1_9PROT|nr:TonB-dependent receptor plug domain-containing protein [Acetobacter pomorum]PHY93894.1 TonB-dependent receptor [Acetobacter pomorum]